MVDSSDVEISRAYEQTDYELVKHGRNLEIPTSTCAAFELTKHPDTANFQLVLDREGYMFIAPYREEGYLSSKVLHPESNEFFHLKLAGKMLRVYPKSEDFSEETLTSFVKTVQHRISDLQWREDA